jgi:hypothetical protein
MAVTTKFAAEKVGHFQTNGGGAFVDTIGTRLMGRTLGGGVAAGLGSGANSFGSSGSVGSLPSSGERGGAAASGLVPGSVISSG